MTQDDFEKKQEKAALSQFMDNYNVSETPIPRRKKAILQDKSAEYSEEAEMDSENEPPASEEDFEEKGEDFDSPKKQLFGIDIKWVALLAVALVLIVAATIILVKTGKKGRDNSKTTKEDLVTEDVSAYQAYAKAATDATSAFFFNSWNSSSDALDDFASLLNAGLPSNMQISHEKGRSYATGKQDPWGTPYYITAKSLGESSQSAKYDFYITSAGKDHLFDTEKLSLSEDDIPNMLLSMEEYIGMKGEHNVYDANDIAAMDNAQSEEPIPVLFDFQGGHDGTPLVNVVYSELLPKIDPPVMEGYDFVGYYAGPDKDGTMYFDKNGVGQFQSPFSDGVTLYAAWEEHIEQPAEPQESESQEEQNQEGTVVGENQSSTQAPQQEVQTPAQPEIPPVQQTQPQPSNPPQETHPAQQPTQTQPINVSYRVDHYVMGENGKYGTTPTESNTYTVEAGSYVKFVNMISQSYASGKTAFDYFMFNGKKATTGSTINNPNNVLSVYYKRATFLVSVEKGDGIASVSGEGSYIAGATVSLVAKPSDGYSVSQWTGKYTSDNGSLTFVMPAENITLSVAGKQNGPAYAISLNANGGTVGTSTIRVHQNAKIPELPNPVYFGYTFSGWYASNGEKINTGDIYSFDSNITVTAKWERISITISFDNCGGTGGSGSISATYGEPLPAISIPSMEGKTFRGYFTGYKGGGTQVYDANGNGSSCWLTENTTLHAYWE